MRPNPDDETAWQLARPNGIVTVVAMYEENQTLPLPTMYSKNLIFKTGSVDARHCAKLMEHIAQGRLRTGFLITHRAPLSDIMEGYHVFEHKLDHCVKWVVTP